MLIRKNTKEFNAIRNLLESYAGDPARRKHIRLFVVKAGETLHDRLPIDELGDEASFYYDLNYSTILSNLRSSDHRLHRSKVPGLYYFKNPHFPQWEQTPFQLTKALMERLDEFEKAVKSRGKAQRAIDDLPEDAAVFAGDTGSQRKEKSTAQSKKEKPKKERKQKEKIKKEEPRELVMGHKHKIHFTAPGEKVFTEGERTREDVARYYDSMSQYILPYLLDHPMAFRIGEKKDEFIRSVESMKEKNIHLPKWVKQVKDTAAKGEHKHYFVCHDKDHMFFALQQGCVELHPQLRAIKDIERLDHFVINLHPYTEWFADVVEVAQTVREVLEGSFESYIKLSEHKGFHIYVPLKEGASWALCRNIAVLVAKQVEALAPKLCTTDIDEARAKEKIFVNALPGNKVQTLIAPYSLIQNSNGRVAAPLRWSEVNRKLDPESFNIRTMHDRVKETGDLFEGLLK